MSRHDAPPLQVVDASASSEEVAAITAAVTAAFAARREPASDGSAELRMWVRAPRLGARRTGMTRGPWQLSGRLVRRVRA